LPPPFGGRTQVVTAVACFVVASPALAHHGFGRFDLATDVEIRGTITRVDFVNPHSWLYLDAETADGVIPMRCEMRAAMVLRRSGWAEDMFVTGAPVTIQGHPHRDDPGSCYLETLTVGDAPAIERYQQFTETAAASERPARTADGLANIFGDWAQEQYLLADPPGDGPGALVPKSLVVAVNAGEIPASEAPGTGWGPRPVTYTEAGQAAAEAFRTFAPEDNPRMRCETTSIVFDWTFDGPVNRISRAETEGGGDAITLAYGRQAFTRTVHMDAEHPVEIAPTRGGHSVGRWEGDVLVVDTIGFAPGVLVPPVLNSEQLHVVERFSLGPDARSLVRAYVATDPAYYTDEYRGADTVLVADVAYAPEPCAELTFVDYAREAGGAEP
jgi:hypothetical protein